MRVKLRNWYHWDEFGLLIEERKASRGWEAELLPRHWKKIRKALAAAQPLKNPGAMRRWQIQIGGGCNPWQDALIIDNTLIW